jgi:uncharacterized protein
MKKTKLIHFLLNTHIAIYLGVCFVTHLLIDIPFLFVPEENTTNDSLEMIEQTGGKAMVFFATVILAPVLETIIYQFSVIKIINWVIKKAVWSFSIAIPVSAFLFALSHPFSIYYQINTLLVGLLYATIFFIAQYRKDWPAFLVVVVLHASWNLFACIMDEIG